MPQANEIDSVFKDEFSGDAKMAYQQMGTKLRKTVQNLNNVEGKKAWFPKFGKVADPQILTGSGDIPIDDAEQDLVGVDLEDRGTGILRKNLDLLKTNTDQKMLAAKSLAAAFGRVTDKQIISALSDTSLSVGDYSTGFTEALCDEATEIAYDNEWPEDGNIFCVLSNKAWQQFKGFSKVSSRDYAGELYPWLKGRQAYVWNEMVWMPHSLLPIAGGNQRDCFMYHKTAIGHGSGSEVQIDIDWIPMKRSFLIAGDMSMGAGLVDGGSDGGVIKIKVNK